MLDRLFRFSLATYNQMGTAGIIGNRDRIELLDGLLVRKPPKTPRRSLAILAGIELLREDLPDTHHVRYGMPVELPGGPAGDSSPEPDLSVARGKANDYRDRHPAATDIQLVAEVRDGGLGRDREGLARYAWFGIPVVWIVNVPARNVEVYTGPSGPIEDPVYATKITRRVGEMLDLTVDDRRIEGLPVAEFFE